MEEKREVVICPGSCRKVRYVKESEEFVVMDRQAIQTIWMSTDKYAISQYLCLGCLSLSIKS